MVERFNKVFDLLASIGGAHEAQRYGFIHAHIDPLYPCDEWRFCGLLGMGGKYRRQKNRVDCYREDETPARLTIIKQLNEALSALDIS